MGRILSAISNIIQLALAVWGAVPPPLQNAALAGVPSMGALAWLHWWEGNTWQDAATYTGIWLTCGLVSLYVLRKSATLPRKRGYDPAHDKRQIFELYEAACLWKGEEPHPDFQIGSPINAVFNLLQEAIRNEEVDLDYKQAYDLGTSDDIDEYEIEGNSLRNLRVTRLTLEKLAAHLGEKPRFLYGHRVKRATTP